MTTPYPTDPDCIFCKIIAGTIPCAKIHEDDHTLAFLDIGPVTPGHTLLIPKAHHEKLDDMPPDTMSKLGMVLPRVAGAVARAVNAHDYNILQNNGRAAGQAVFHVHFHLLPRLNENSGFRFDWPAEKLDNDRAAELRDAIIKQL